MQKIYYAFYIYMLINWKKISDYLSPRFLLDIGAPTQLSLIFFLIGFSTDLA
jgi:hypothetical protein